MSERGAVGFIGLGNIGAPMAKGLRKWPGGLIVCDANEAAVAPFVAKGVAAVETGAEVAKLASVICVMVQNATQVEAVLVGPDGILATAEAGTVVAVHSTISPEDAERLAAIAAESGVDLVDAPVSGGAMGAHGGTLAIMVGGTEEAAAKCEPVFGYFAELVAYMGPIGSGTRTKIARNLITFASFAAVGEAQRLAEAAGLDLTKLGEVVRHSDAVTGGPGAIMLRPQAGEMAPDDGLRPIFAHSGVLGSKDLMLAIAMADSLGVE
ncbi:MAG TPA: NAD(P)-dependent oxidoreductase, partial [Microthrixaceae bacterium]|nr:NAD(P)-dependent oxidoreductase [Microthrixaceae bacterium]